MKTSTKIWMCLDGCALVVIGVLCILYPGSTLLSISWLFGLFFLSVVVRRWQLGQQPAVTCRRAACRSSLRCCKSFSDV